MKLISKYPTGVRLPDFIRLINFNYDYLAYSFSPLFFLSLPSLYIYRVSLLFFVPQTRVPCPIGLFTFFIRIIRTHSSFLVTSVTRWQFIQQWHIQNWIAPSLQHLERKGLKTKTNRWKKKKKQPTKQNKVNLEGGSVLNRERKYSPALSKVFWGGSMLWFCPKWAKTL